MELMYKYPRTRHIEGSRKQVGDEELEYISFKEIKDYYLVLEEKVDGANSGISFDEDGNLLLQSRGHFLNGGYGEQQFALMKVWANCHKTELYDLLGSRYIMYGEWLYAKHTVFYDALTHYFMEFDIFDKETKQFLSTKKRREFLKGVSFITSVLVLFEGRLNNLDELTRFLGKSHFKSDHYMQSLEKQCKDFQLSFELVKKQTDLSELMEGIYIKVEGEPAAAGEPASGDFVLNRCKYVRASFLNTILDSNTHWMNRPVLPNLLKDGVDLYSSSEV